MKPRLTLVAGLLALAAASTAQAQSSVNLYGLLDLSVGQTKTPARPVRSVPWTAAT